MVYRPQESTRLLLPTPALSPPRVTLSSWDRELLIQGIMEAVCPGQSVIRERSQGPDIELVSRSILPVNSIPVVDVPTPVSYLEGKVDPSSAVPLGPDLGVNSSVFLLWTPGTWGEPMFTDGHVFTLYVGRLVGWCEEWPLSGVTDERGWTELYSGKRGWSRWEGQPPKSSRGVLIYISSA